MAQIVWSKLAIIDLKLSIFYCQRIAFLCSKAIESFFNRVTELTKFPESGREVPEFVRKDIRELIKSNFRIDYKMGSKTTYILRVHPSSRKIRSRRIRNSN
jgi:plasmid stabilization system protein ParE